MNLFKNFEWLSAIRSLSEHKKLFTAIIIDDLLYE